MSGFHPIKDNSILLGSIIRWQLLLPYPIERSGCNSKTRESSPW